MFVLDNFIMPKTRTINIHGIIGTSFWDDTVSLNSFLRDFKEAENDDECDQILIDINSPGGSIGEGISIYNHIAQSEKQVVTRISGIAYSMGAIIALSGDTVVMFENATLMLHNCSGLAYGNAQDLEARVEMMQKVDNGIIASVATRSGLSKEEVRNKYFDYKDHTLDADECLEAKLVDELIEGKRSKVADDLKGKSMEEVLAYFNQGKSQETNFFDKLGGFIKNQLNPKPNKPTTPNPAENSDEPKDEPMKIKSSLKALMAIFSLEAKEGEEVIDHQPTEEQLTALNDQLGAADDLQNQLDAANTQKAELENALKDTLKAHKLDSELTGKEGIELLGERIKELGARTPNAPLENNEEEPLKTNKDNEDEEDPELKAAYEQIEALQQELNGPTKQTKTESENK